MGEDDLNKSEKALNEKMQDEREMEKTKAEISNIKQKILNSLPQKYTVLSISDPIDKIGLGGRVEQENVFAVKIEDEKRKIKTLIFNNEGQELATIDENNRVVLQEKMQKELQELVGKTGEQNEKQKEYYDFQKEYSLTQEEMDRISEKFEDKKMDLKDKKQTRNFRFAECLGVSEGDMLSIAEIKEQDSRTVIVDKDKKHSKIYVVELARDSAGRGSHDWVAVEEKANRFL